MDYVSYDEYLENFEAHASKTHTAPPALSAAPSVQSIVGQSGAYDGEVHFSLSFLPTY
jgi:hypothetical protein